MRNAQLVFQEEGIEAPRGIAADTDQEGRKMLYGVLVAMGLVAGALITAAVLSMNSNRDLPLDPACSLSSHACSRTLPDGTRISVRIAPNLPSALKPFNVDVHLSGNEAVRVEFSERGADDGLDQARLTQVGPEHWQGVGRLSLCGSAAMTATVVVSIDGLEWRVPFGFAMESAR